MMNITYVHVLLLLVHDYNGSESERLKKLPKEQKNEKKLADTHTANKSN